MGLAYAALEISNPRRPELAPVPDEALAVGGALAREDAMLPGAISVEEMHLVALPRDRHIDINCAYSNVSALMEKGTAA